MRMNSRGHVTNSKRKDPLQEARNPIHNRIRFQKRQQEEREASRRLKEELTQRDVGDELDDMRRDDDSI